MSRCASRSRTCGFDNVAETAFSNLALTAAGTPVGAKMPNQKRKSTSAVFTPTSVMVGTFGSTGERSVLVTARPLILPASTRPLATWIDAMFIATCPARLAQLLRDLAGQRVGCAAGRKCHHQPDRPIGIGGGALRLRRGCDAEQRANEEAAAKETAHGLPSASHPAHRRANPIRSSRIGSRAQRRVDCARRRRRIAVECARKRRAARF